VGEVVNQLVELSHSSNPPAMDLCADLDCKPIGYHVIYFSQPLSSGSFNPLDSGVSCSYILDFIGDFHEDQIVDGVGVEKPICAIIFYEYMWESEEEPMVKDDLLLFAPRLLYLDIFCDSAISVFSHENSSPDVSSSDHS